MLVISHLLILQIFIELLGARHYMPDTRQISVNEVDKAP